MTMVSEDGHFRRIPRGFSEIDVENSGYGPQPPDLVGCQGYLPILESP